MNAARLQVRLAREARSAAREQAAWTLLQDLASALIRNPIVHAIGGLVATNELAKNNKYITGPQAVALQFAILTPGLLIALADAAGAFLRLRAKADFGQWPQTTQNLPDRVVPMLAQPR